MDINDLTFKIRGCVFEVYNRLGPGLLESVYEKALMYELAYNGIKAENQCCIPLVYREQNLGEYLKLDILVEDTVILELKSVETVLPVHKKQLLSYLKLTGKKVGLLINFNESNMSNGIYRIIN